MKVLDASALLAYVFGETGADVVEQQLSESVMHTVNWAEVLSKLAERGLMPEDALAQMDEAGITQLLRIDPGTPTDAAEVARLLTRMGDLSLGDRYCLALGRRLQIPVVTADQAWTRLALDLDIQCIR